MARAEKGPKNTASGWPNVYNQPKTPGRTRYVFWRGPGHPKHLVRGNDLSTDAFRAAYARFMAGLPPYEDRPARKPRRNPAPEMPLADDLYGSGTVGWLVLKHIRSLAFQRQRNQRAIEAQLRWLIAEPLDPAKPDGRRVGEMPVCHFTAKAIQTLIERKVQVETVEEAEPKTGRKRTVVKAHGDRQANNIIKWLRPIGKLAVGEGLWQHNLVLNVQKYKIQGGGFRMWTDEQWERATAFYPLGTKQRLVLDLAGYTGQRRGDVYVLGWHNYLPPEEGVPLGSLEVTPEKGSQGEGEAQVAYIPILPELHDSLEAAKAAGVLGSKFWIVKDGTDEPYGKEAFGNMVRRWLNRAGVPKGYSLHGLRKLFVCRLIERDCAPHDVMAATGHKTLKEIDRYAKEYFRQKKKAVVYEKWRSHAVHLGIPVGGNLTQAA